MKRTNLSEDELDKLFSHLSGSVQGPKGKYTAEETYPGLRNKLFAKRSKRISFFKYVSVAASFALLISLSTYFYMTSQPEMIVVTTTNHLQEVALPDGSQVTLSRYSSLEYPSKFSKGKRDVTLSGEGYFDVAKDKARPFIVSADKVNIEVLGTQFNVQSYPKDAYVKTTLLEGSVAVSNLLNEGKAVLKPNESAVFYKETGSLDKRIEAEALNEISWREGKFIFSDMTLLEITENLSNYFNRDIHINSSELKAYKLTVHFEHGETMEEILHILQRTAGFDWEEMNGTITISSNK